MTFTIANIIFMIIAMLAAFSAGTSSKCNLWVKDDALSGFFGWVCAFFAVCAVLSTIAAQS